MAGQNQDFQLSWGQHQQHSAQALKTLWESEEFLDVTLACDDDQVQAHKVILSAASPFFKKILQRNPHNHPLLYIRGTTKREIVSLLNFIYSGEATVIQDELSTFMALADSLEIQGLVSDESVPEPPKLTDKPNTKMPRLVKKEEKKQKENVGLESVAENRKQEKKMKTKLKGSMEARESQNTGKDEDWYQEIQSFIKTEILKDNDKPSTRIDERNDASYKNEIGSQLEMKTEKISLNKDSKDKDSTENEASVQSESTLNTNMQEYEEKVSSLCQKSETGWGCTECAYTAKNKTHVAEHVEAHITGFAHICKHCDRTFNMKRSLRHHVRRCRTNITI